MKKTTINKKSFRVQDIIDKSKSSDELEKNIKKFFEFHLNSGAKNIHNKSILRLRILHKMLTSNIKKNNVFLFYFFCLKFQLYNDIENLSYYSSDSRILFTFMSIVRPCPSSNELNEIQTSLPVKTFNTEIIVILQLIIRFYKEIEFHSIIFCITQKSDLIKLIILKKRIEDIYQLFLKKLTSRIYPKNSSFLTM